MTHKGAGEGVKMVKNTRPHGLWMSPYDMAYSHIFVMCSPGTAYFSMSGSTKKLGLFTSTVDSVVD